MSAKHTKGPWNLTKMDGWNYIHIGKSPSLGLLATVGDSTTTDFEDANAKLMVEAPKMFELLTALTESKLFNEMVVLHGRSTGKTHLYNALNESKELIKKLTS